MKKLFWTLTFILLMLAAFSINAAARTDFVPDWPLKNGFRVHALDVYSGGGYHTGMDIFSEGEVNQNIYSIADNGVVVRAFDGCDHHNAGSHTCITGAKSGGNEVWVVYTVNDKKFFVTYAHMLLGSVQVKKGDTVSKGQILGRMGSSGASTGPHLHMDICEGSGWNEAAQRNTFDFYKDDNLEVLKKLRIKKEMGTKSKYGAWIKQNGILENGYYTFKHLKPPMIVEEGVYEIENRFHKGYVLDVVDGSKSNKAYMQLYKRNNTPAQQFVLTFLGDDYYLIQNMKSKKVLDAQSGGTTIGTRIWQYNVNNTDAQIWKIEAGGSNSYRFINKKSGLVMGNSPTTSQNGLQVYLDREFFTPEQYWFLNKVTNNCKHTSYDSYGYCKKCYSEFPLNLSGGSFTTTTTKDKVPIRNRPYSPETPTSHVQKKGTSVNIVGYAYNSYHKLWFKTAEGKWIFSGNVNLDAANTAVIKLKATSNETAASIRLNAECSYTGQKPSEVGLYFGTSKSNMTKREVDKTTYKSPFNVWYDVTGLKKGTTYYYSIYSMVNGVERSSEVAKFTLGTSKTLTIPEPVQNTMPDPVEIDDSVKLSAKHTDIRTDGLKITGTCEYNDVKPTEVGIYMGLSKEKLVKIYSTTIKGDSKKFTFPVNINGITLQDPYYYKIYAIVDGEEEYSKVYTFNLKKPVVDDFVDALDKIELPVTIKTVNATDVTKDFAKVNGSCSYTGTRPTEVGLMFGTDEHSLSKKASDKIDFSKNPFDIWYELSNLTFGTKYYYQFYAVVDGKTYYSDTNHFITKGVTGDMLSALDSIPKNVKLTVNAATEVTKNSAKVTGVCSYEGTRPTEVGILLGTAENSLSKYAKDTINFSKNPFDIWYDLKDLKMTTKYYYQLYAIVDGKTLYSEKKSFRTEGVTNDVASALQNIPQNTPAQPTTNLTLTVNEASNVAQNTAKVTGGCSYTGTRPTEVGILLGTSENSLSKHARDAINFSKNPFDVWYDLSGLKPSTTYYYQLYAVVDGKTIYSQKKSFKTKNVVNSLVDALPTANTYQAVVINTGSLAINNKAAASPKYSTEIGSIPKGATCTVYPDKSSGNWYYVTYNGISGYAYGTYLKRK